jgi:hypothetical protein
MLLLSQATAWKADYTLNWIGTQKLANTTTDPEFGKMPEYSPGFHTDEYPVNQDIQAF